MLYVSSYVFTHCFPDFLFCNCIALISKAVSNSTAIHCSLSLLPAAQHPLLVIDENIRSSVLLFYIIISIVRFSVLVGICNAAYLFSVSCKRKTSCSELYELENDTLSLVTRYLLPDTSASSIPQLSEMCISKYI